MDEIAESASNTSFAAVQSTARFSEVGDGGQLAVDRPGGVPSRVERVTGLLGGIFVFETRVDIPD